MFQLMTILFKAHLIKWTDQIANFTYCFNFYFILLQLLLSSHGFWARKLNDSNAKIIFHHPARISLTLSFATSPYRSSPLAGLQGYILYPHIAVVCMFELVVLPLPGHMWGSIGVYHLWARLCFSISVGLVFYALTTRKLTKELQWGVD